MDDEPSDNIPEGSSEKPLDEIPDGVDRKTSSPADLITQGTSFLSNLMQTLSDPEQTRELVDTLVREDPATGKTSLNIPVPDKKTVTNFFNLLGQLMGNH